jgi:biopolymer transport protein ExbB/TolQ
MSASEENKSTGFFKSFKTDRGVITQTGAGAGFVGLIGFASLCFVSAIFFITENYFISMFTISIGLLVYVTGLNLIKLILSSFSIFFTSKHLVPKAAFLQESLNALKSELKIKRDRQGEIVQDSTEEIDTIVLPDNTLSMDIKNLIDQGKDFDSLEYLAHSYYVECHELYESSSSNYEFVSSSMPLFGLIGTIIGLIAMFDSLGADVTVESLAPQLALALKTTLYGAIFSSLYKILGTRFERRMTILDYDYETFCRGLQVILENKNKVKVE